MRKNGGRVSETHLRQNMKFLYLDGEQDSLGAKKCQNRLKLRFDALMRERYVKKK